MPMNVGVRSASTMIASGAILRRRRRCRPRRAAHEVYDDASARFNAAMLSRCMKIRRQTGRFAVPWAAALESISKRSTAASTAAARMSGLLVGQCTIPPKSPRAKEECHANAILASASPLAGHEWRLPPMKVMTSMSFSSARAFRHQKKLAIDWRMNDCFRQVRCLL